MKYMFFVVSLLSLWSFSFGKTIAGQRCWYALGSFLAKAAIQPQALRLWFLMTSSALQLFLPVLLILPQPDPGSALIYSIVLYQGLPGTYGLAL
jgi:rod shape determining protein RodA